MRKYRLAAILSATIIFAGILQASTLGVTVKGGSLGLGGDLTLNLGERINLRGGINWARLTSDIDLDEADIESDIEWNTFPVLLDWHPFESVFRLTGGVIFNANEVKFTGTPKEAIRFNGTDYSLDSLDGGITFDDVAGYVGLGFGNAVGDDGRWHVACDIGVMIQGSPDVDLTATASNAAFQSMLNNDVDAAVDTFLDDNEDKVAIFGFYPVISIGVSLAL